MSQHWDPSYLALCQQWHKLGQNNVKNVSALGFSISITCVNNDTNWEKIVSALGLSISIIVSTMAQAGQNSAKNVSALGFSISIIVSTMTQNGEK